MEVYRGEIFYIKRSGNVTGSEQESGRPAVIVSNDVGNKHSNIIEVVYLTTKQKNPLPTHAKINCQVQSTALCEQIVSVSKERLGDYIRTCTDHEMAALDKALMVSIGLKENGNDQNDLKLLNDHLAAALDQCSDYEKQVEMLLTNIVTLEKKKEILEFTINYFSKQEKTDCSDSLIRVETERDLYNNLYEQMIERGKYHDDKCKRVFKANKKTQ